MASPETIRQALRGATAAAHGRLDAAMAHRDLARPSEYARFLRIQAHARAPIEEWVAGHCPVDLQSPTQTALIQADLAELGETGEHPAVFRFTAPVEGALGVAWALGGSSLGNRAMLADLRKSGAAVPTRFLADDAMPGFFIRLRRVIDRPADGFADLAAAIAAAHSVFAAFERVSDAEPLRRAA